MSSVAMLDEGVLAAEVGGMVDPLVSMALEMIA